MRFLFLALTIAIFSLNAFAQPSSDLPSPFGKSISQEQFPEYKELRNVERGLRRYRTELEYFRAEILERYNRAVLDYREKLVDSDKQVEIDRKKGMIADEEYKVRHFYIKDELRKSRGSGEYMKVYFTYLKKYRSEARWVRSEIEVEKKARFRF